VSVNSYGNGKKWGAEKARNRHKCNFQNEPTNLVGLTTSQNSSQFRKNKKSRRNKDTKKNPAIVIEPNLPNLILNKKLKIYNHFF